MIKGVFMWKNILTVVVVVVAEEVAKALSEDKKCS